MSRPTRATAAGRAYLDLQNRARAEGRGTQEFLTLYVVERWLARLSTSPYADQFVIKGGMLLAAYDARRPTADLDALARSVASDEASILSRVTEIARLVPSLDDGVVYRTETATARLIRDQALYAGVRIAMDSEIATATVKFRLDVNFGDPITPAPSLVTMPPLRPTLEPVRVLGYPIETVLAEKLATAIALGPANTRVRDYADIYTLTGKHLFAHDTVRAALLATAAFRGTPVTALSDSVGNIVELRRQAYAAYCANLGAAGMHLPADFAPVVTEVVAFADSLTQVAPAGTIWNPQQRRWVVELHSQGQELPNLALVYIKAAPAAPLPGVAPGSALGGPPGARRATPQGRQINAAHTSRRPARQPSCLAACCPARLAIEQLSARAVQ